jgi:hypothetical protein
LFPCFLFAQDSTNWINKIDTATFKTSMKKKKIPKDFYPILNITSLNQIANPGDPVDLSCNRKDIPGSRLNWIKYDKKNHWVISITAGGLYVKTHYYFIGRNKKKLSSKEIDFKGVNGNDSYSISELIRRMNQNTK